MTTADEFAQIVPGVFYWSAYARDLKADLSCSAITHEDRLYLIDPIALRQQALDQLVKIARPAAVLLTSQTHGRASARYQQEFSVPVYAHKSAVEDLKGEVTVDEVLSGGEKLFDFLDVIHIPGTKPGECAFYTLRDGGSLFIGDALINLPGYELAFLPDKYSDDPNQSRCSLSKLRGLDFQRVLFAHGEPVVERAQERFEQLLAQGGKE